MSVYIPHPGNTDVQQFIADNVETPTGSITDDFKAALVSATEASASLSIDDLWKLYITDVAGYTWKGPNVGSYPDFEFVPIFRVTSVSPSVLENGATVDVSVFGRLFDENATVDFGAGITVNSVTFVDERELTVNVTVAFGADAGARTVTVTNPDTSEATKENAVSVNQYEHNMVVFDGTNDYLYKTGALAGAGVADGFTFAAKIRRADAGNNEYLLCANATLRLRVQITSNGAVSLQALTAGFDAGISGTLIAANLLADTDYTLHIDLDHANEELAVYVNGVAQSLPSLLTVAGTIDYSDSSFDNWFVCADPSAVSKVTGQVGFVYFALENGIDPTAFYNDGDVYLGSDGTASGAPEPLIFFGGRQSATDWNDGTNQGTGGNFTMNGELD